MYVVIVCAAAAAAALSVLGVVLTSAGLLVASAVLYPLAVGLLTWANVREHRAASWLLADLSADFRELAEREQRARDELVRQAAAMQAVFDYSAGETADKVMQKFAETTGGGD